MKSIEAAMLCRYVAAGCPQQKFDEHTPDVWQDLLADMPFGVAMIATRSLVQSQTFVSPSEIRRAVSRMRTLTRRAIRQECRDRSVLADVNAEADRAIVAGLAKFDGHDLLAADADPHAYGRPTADLTGWTPEHGRELTS